MYQEWMEGVPILVPGCYEHNIEQLKKAKHYYIEHNDFKTANSFQQSINEEQYKLDKQNNKPNKFKQILNIIFN